MSAVAAPGPSFGHLVTPGPVALHRSELRLPGPWWPPPARASGISSRRVRVALYWPELRLPGPGPYMPEVSAVRPLWLSTRPSFGHLVTPGPGGPHGPSFGHLDTRGLGACAMATTGPELRLPCPGVHRHVSTATGPELRASRYAGLGCLPWPPPGPSFVCRALVASTRPSFACRAPVPSQAKVPAVAAGLPWWPPPARASPAAPWWPALVASTGPSFACPASGALFSRSTAAFVPLAPPPFVRRGALRAWSAALSGRCRAGRF